MLTSADFLTSAAATPGATRRQALCSLALVAAAAALPASAQGRPAISAAINRVARYRALSQRLAKAYGLVLLDVRAAQSRQVLVQTRQAMASGFQTLGDTGWTGDVAQQLMQMRASVQQLDASTQQPGSKQALVQVAEQSDQLLEAANTAAGLLEKQAQAPTARLINLAGRQRMVSQRLAKDYVLRLAGQDSAPVRDRMAADTKEFEANFAQLSKAPVSTPAIAQALEMTQAQWLFFSAAVRRAPDRRGVDEVATTSERLLELTDQLTDGYEAALREILG